MKDFEVGGTKREKNILYNRPVCC